MQPMKAHWKPMKYLPPYQISQVLADQGVLETQPSMRSAPSQCCSLCLLVWIVLERNRPVSKNKTYIEQLPPRKVNSTVH